MFWKNLVNAWKGDPSRISALYDQFDGMLAMCQDMFVMATDSMFGSGSDDAVRDLLHEKDVRVNKDERRIRRGVMGHLTKHPEEDTSSALILMSIVKDAERLGDYCKNIYELCDLLPICRRSTRSTTVNGLKEVRDDIAELYVLVRKAVKRGSRSRAEKALLAEKTIGSQCDGFLARVSTRQQSVAEEAVGLTLLARFFKRSAAHLGNIASSIVMPLDKLDYFDEKHLSNTAADRKAR